MTIGVDIMLDGPTTPVAHRWVGGMYLLLPPPVRSSPASSTCGDHDASLCLALRPRCVLLPPLPVSGPRQCQCQGSRALKGVGYDFVHPTEKCMPASMGHPLLRRAPYFMGPPCFTGGAEL